MMTTPTFFRRRPVKDEPFAMDGLVLGVTRMAHAIESLSVYQGRVDWSTGRPKIIRNAAGTSSMTQSAPMRFFRNLPRDGKPVSLSGMADGLSAMATALESLSMHKGRVVWAQYIPTIISDAEGTSRSAESNMAPVRFFKRQPRPGDSMHVDGFADGLWFMATALEHMTVQDGRVEWANDEPKLIFGEST